MTCRRLTQADLPLWREIRLEALAAYPENYLTTLAEEQAKPDPQVAALLATGQVIGSFVADDLTAVLSLSAQNRAATAHRAWINALYVRPQWQGSGVAGALMTFARACAEAEGRTQLDLYVAADNRRALRFYEKLGFQQCGRIPRAVRLPDGRYQDDLHLCLMLA